jgi:choline dehydrogenase-like flavoprotein
MMYTRASASDYDDWERVHGNAGWGSEDLIPLLKKVRLFAPPDLGDYPYPYPFLGKTTYHPLCIADGDVSNCWWLAHAWVRWSAQGLPRCDDARLWRSVPASCRCARSCPFSGAALH